MDKLEGSGQNRHVFDWESHSYTVLIKNDKAWTKVQFPIVEHDAATGKPVGYRVGQFYADTPERATEWEEAVDRLLLSLAHEQFQEAIARHRSSSGLLEESNKHS